MSGTDATDGALPFEDAFDSADCDLKTTRKYLSWFDELGVVTRYDGHPATYERNRAYFNWRHINQLAADRSVEDLQDRVRELTTSITDHEDSYDAASPAAVAAAEGSDER